MRTQKASAVVVAIIALATTTLLAAQPPSGTPVTIVVYDSPSAAWLVVSPLGGTSPAPPQPVVISAGELGIAQLPQDAASYICVGADNCATSCVTKQPNEDFATFKMVDGVTLRGRIELGRTPAANARVFLRPTGIQSRRAFTIPLRLNQSGQPITSVLTDVRGAFEIEHVSPGTYSLESHLENGRVHDSGPFTISDSLSANAKESMQLPVIVIPDGLRTVVEVRDDAGSPVGGARVSVLQRYEDGIAFLAEAVADGKGLVEFSGLTADLGVHVTCGAPGFARGDLRTSAPAPIQSCLLRRWGAVEGVVTSERGTPAGAVVNLSGTELSAGVAPDGSFNLSRVPPGSYDVRVAAVGYSGVTRSVVVGPGATARLGVISLSAADQYGGRVVDGETRLPVAGALVQATEPFASVAVTTDEEGRFSISVDRVLGSTIEAFASGYARATYRLMPSDDAPAALIMLERPGALEVMVWQEPGESPCGACTVTVLASDYRESATTNAGGVVRFESLPPGTYQVFREKVTAGASIVQVSSGLGSRLATVKPGTTTRVELGEPTRTVIVTLMPQPSSGCRLSGVSAARSVSGVRDAATGAYRMALREREMYRVSLGCGSAGAHIGTIPAEFHGSLTFRLGTSTLRGSVSPLDVGAGREVTLSTVADGMLAAWGRIGPDGHFAVPYLTQGVYWLAIPGSSSPVAVNVSPGVTEVAPIVLRAP